MASLADTLNLLAPSLAPVLVPQNALVSLAHLTRQLPPLVMAGLEVRLGAGDDQVDLQVRVDPAVDEARVLALYIRDGVASGALPDHVVWRRLTEFCEHWASRPNATPALTDVWLELDADCGGSVPIVPSVFVSLSADIPREQAFIQTMDLVAELQGRSLPAPTVSALRRCFDACPAGAFVSHVGVMLGRDTPALRVNLHRVRADDVVACLRAVGCRPDEDTLLPLLAEFYGLVDHIRLCVSMHEDEVQDLLGLELFYQQPQGLDPRWRGLLEALCRRGLCDPPKADALLSWPETMTPAAARAPWPTHLVMHSLTRDGDAFSTVERRLGHIKLDVRDGRILRAKAYLGWVHAWTKARESNFTQPAFTSSRSACADAVDAATQFLLGARSQGGWWWDFTKLNGGSDEWVTAYVATTLAQGPNKAGRRAARWAWSLLDARRPEASGWGYAVPPDADSTAWTVLLACALGLEQSESARLAEAFILRHWQPGGGFATYLDGPSRALAGGVPEGSVCGWTRAHACVTAAVAGIPTFAPRALDWLGPLQHADGHWTGYWWPDPVYTTTLAAEAFARRGLPSDRERVEAAARWALARMASTPPHVERSPFALALVVRVLLLSSDVRAVRDPIATAVGWLLDNQSEGAWESSARFRFPPFDRLDPDTEGHGRIYLDDQRLFTTATVLTALHCVQASEGLG